MLRRSMSRGHGSSNPQRLALAVAILLIPWLQIVSAAEQQAQQQDQHHPQPGSLHHDQHPPLRHSGDASPGEAAIPHFDVTAIDHFGSAEETPYILNQKKSPILPQHQQHAPNQEEAKNGRPTKSRARRDLPSKRPSKENTKNDNINIPSDASALATLAPAQPVRAPHAPRHLRPSSSSAAGLASPHVARSLADWEVEDFVLLATVDGDLYASDRKTGTELWHLEVDQPMIETIHHRANSSAVEEDFSPIDHYIWAVEPNRDGGIYVWIPDSGAGLVRTSFSMKRLVEELAPFADDDPPVVYTGDKKTTLITVDAATGRVLKWFGSTGSHVNEAESCLRPNTLYNPDSTECSSTGTITLGRTEYTVGIQRRDGQPIATLKYAEWVPNNYDNDLWHQYSSTLDSRYITSRHDGKVYAFDYNSERKTAPAPKFGQEFSAPVARVFDVCRPWDAPADSNPELVVLPQPPMPSHDTETARIRSNSIFLNHTESGSWYAMSGRIYPLIIDAPSAKASHSEWLDLVPPVDKIDMDDFSQALVGTHLLDISPRGGGKQQATLPGGSVGPIYEDGDNESYLPAIVPDDALDVSLINRFKSLPQSAANSIIDFISNPTLFLVFVVAIAYNEQNIRRSYQRLRSSAPWQKLWGRSSKELEASYELDNAGQVTEPSPGTLEKTLEDESGKSVTQDSTTEEKAQGGTLQPAAPEAAVTSEAAAEGQSSELPQVNGAGIETAPEKKKKAHRGRRGGVKHRKGKAKENTQSQGDEAAPRPLDDAVSTAMKLGGPQQNAGVEPNVMTVQPNDMQAVGDPIIRMGSIEVNTEIQLGSGSNGTLVFAGKFDGRDVAVKRMLIHFYDIASQETRLLRESDDHPNVVRYYSQQMQDGFLYIALERCAASLSQIIEKPRDFPDLAKAGSKDLPAVLYQITNGISHLHSLRIVHRDLKPQNILVNMGKNGKPHMLVSDFGLCKKLEDTQSSFGATTGRAAGTTGWRAPELLIDDDAEPSLDPDLDTHSGSGSVLIQDPNSPNKRRATRAIDIFSLGMVFFYVLSGGNHAFDHGDRYMREVNVRQGKINLEPLDSLGDFSYEAKDLIASMLANNPKERPTALEVMAHPFFWSAKKRLAFLCDVSDHFEKEPRDPPSRALQELENQASVTGGDFLRLLPREFVDSMGKQRKYTGGRLLDLLRAMRNKRNHYEDMSESLQRMVGPLPEGYLSFWTVRFPNLLLACWNVVYELRWDESDRFKEYYEPAGL